MKTTLVLKKSVKSILVKRSAKISILYLAKFAKFVYSPSMLKMKKSKKASLIKTNPYLQDPADRDAWLTRSVISSSAIEGARSAACRALGVEEKAKQVKVGYVASRSSRSRR